ncbi:MAG: porin family protein [Lentisphaeria bacterium]|nr:porin family protein [Lentisphaeria bacterium]
MRKFHALMMIVAAMVMLTPAFARAAEEEDGLQGVYLRLGAGYTFPDEVDGKITGKDTAAFGAVRMDAELNFEDGWGLDIALGKELCPVFRAELALMWNENEWHDTAAPRFGVVDYEMTQRVRGPMFNIYAQLSSKCLTPYIMAGVGYVDVDADIELKGVGPAAGLTGDITISEDVWAFQVGAGVEVCLTEDLALGVEYRYFFTDDPIMASGSGYEVRTEIGWQQIMVNLRLRF